MTTARLVESSGEVRFLIFDGPAPDVITEVDLYQRKLYGPLYQRNGADTIEAIQTMAAPGNFDADYRRLLGSGPWSQVGRIGMPSYAESRKSLTHQVFENIRRRDLGDRELPLDMAVLDQCVAHGLDSDPSAKPSPARPPLDQGGFANVEHQIRADSDHWVGQVETVAGGILGSLDREPLPGVIDRWMDDRSSRRMRLVHTGARDGFLVEVEARDEPGWVNALHDDEFSERTVIEILAARLLVSHKIRGIHGSHAPGAHPANAYLRAQAGQTGVGSNRKSPV